MTTLLAAIGLFGAIAALWAVLDDWRHPPSYSYWTTNKVGE